MPYADPIKRRAANLRAQHKRRGKLPGSAVTPGATVEPEPAPEGMVHVVTREDGTRIPFVRTPEP